MFDGWSNDEAFKVVDSFTARVVKGSIVKSEVTSHSGQGKLSSLSGTPPLLGDMCTRLRTRLTGRAGGRSDKNGEDVSTR